MHYFSIASIFKNESHILKEWIEHYLFHGVDHFYLVNDDSNDSYLSILDEYIKRGIVTLFQNDIKTKDVGRQTRIYEKYFGPILSETTWLSILDLDEFLYCPNEINIKKVLQNNENISQIIVDWVHFGSNDHTYQPISTVEGFTMRDRLVKSGEYHGYKNIIKTSTLRKFEIHQCFVDGPTVNLSWSSGNNTFMLNHYNVQSWQFYNDIKMTRGDVNNWFPHINKERNKQLFISYDKNIEFDDQLYKQNIEIIKKLKRESIPNGKDITVVITSCNRINLLKQTIESFLKYNTYPIHSFLIIDDSGKKGCIDDIMTIFPHISFKIAYNSKNIGQLRSIDKVYSYVRTPYIFHCEDDWRFKSHGFIERSMEFLDNEKNSNIFCVWLRAHNDTNGHPIEKNVDFGGYYYMSSNHAYVYQNKKQIWGGITFNPSLRRTKDCFLLHPYYINCRDPNVPELYTDEYEVNTHYLKLGFRAVITTNTAGYVEHIGYGHHIKRMWENN